MGLSHPAGHIVERGSGRSSLPRRLANARSPREQMSVGELESSERPYRSDAEEASCLGWIERQLCPYSVRSEGPGFPAIQRC